MLRLITLAMACYVVTEYELGNKIIRNIKIINIGDIFYKRVVGLTLSTQPLHKKIFAIKKILKITCID